MSIQLRRPIVAGYGLASRGAIARDDARGARRRDECFCHNARARGADRRARSTSMTVKWVLAHGRDVTDATRS